MCSPEAEPPKTRLLAVFILGRFGAGADRRPALRRDIAATQHDCGAITVAASEGARPAAAAVRVATSGVESVGAEEVGRTL